MAKAITQYLLAGLLFVVPVSAGNCQPDRLPTVRVYYQEKVLVSLYDQARAFFIASRAFRGIGVNVEWRELDSPPPRESDGCGPVEDIELEIERSRVGQGPPDSLAYATPMRTSGTRIHVYYDRVLVMSRQVPNLLGYVLAHEIGHVLEGVARHSDAGILKAKWGAADYGMMAAHSLTFSPEDTERIGDHFNPPHRAMN